MQTMEDKIYRLDLLILKTQPFYARQRSSRRVWCSARVGVAEFYHARGFASVGEPFALPQYSDEPYVRMEHHLAG